MWPDVENTELLLADARRGNDGAVNQLLEKHREAVRQMIALRMDQKLKRRLDASDIVQEVMIEASRRLQKYLQDPVMPFHLWLRQMAKDRLIDAHRRHRGAARRIHFPMNQGMSLTSSDWVSQLRWANKKPPRTAGRLRVSVSVWES